MKFKGVVYDGMGNIEIHDFEEKDKETAYEKFDEYRHNWDNAFILDLDEWENLKKMIMGDKNG
jgi:hypothetical protein